MTRVPGVWEKKTFQPMELAVPYCFIPKILKNIRSNFENTKFKMESSKLNKF